MYPTGEPLSSKEAIRLVIWDLDETFWRGTLTEGGIFYLQDNHDIVVALAKRGILSSICSKNALQPVKDILVERELWKYFIFPSIDWESKGPRLAALVKAVQLRPETILFIDDNPLNRSEALHFVPGLQVADETVIPALLDNVLCRGKNDRQLTRLAQYKVLEARQQEDVVGDNAAFLRASEIRVTIEHHLEPHLDRVIELINRTNQLNFTKKRLPEDRTRAQRELRHLLNDFTMQAGLVHVQDRYGDYGMVGFYVTRSYAGAVRLVHFCFSCRTLGMGVERWLYDKLGKPEVKVVGEVLTDLFAPQDPIDWINNGNVTAGEAAERLAGRVLLRGGCSMTSTAHYLTLNADDVVGEFNIARDDLSVRLDHSIFLRHALQGLPPAAVAAAGRLGYRPEDFTSALAADPAGFDICILNFLNDADYALYRHPTLAFSIPFFEAGHTAGDVTKQQIRFSNAALERSISVLREDGYIYEAPSATAFAENLSVILKAIPDTVKLFFLMAPESEVDGNGNTTIIRKFVELNRVVTELSAGRANVHLLPILDFVEDPADRPNATHFNRMVYYRVCKKITQILAS